MSKEIFKENIFAQHDVENKQLNEENDKLRKEESEKLRSEHDQSRKNYVVKGVTIKESREIKSLEEDKKRQIIIIIGLKKISL